MAVSIHGRKLLISVLVSKMTLHRLAGRKYLKGHRFFKDYIGNNLFVEEYWYL